MTTLCLDVSKAEQARITAELQLAMRRIGELTAAGDAHLSRALEFGQHCHEAYLKAARRYGVS